MRLFRALLFITIMFAVSYSFGAVSLKENPKLAKCVIDVCKSTTGCRVTDSENYEFEGLDRIKKLDCSPSTYCAKTWPGYSLYAQRKKSSCLISKTTYGITSLRHISKLNKVSELRLDYNPISYYLNSMENMTSLKILKMNYCKLAKLPKIPYSVEMLSVNYNRFNYMDRGYKPLLNLAVGGKRLISLYIKGNSLEDAHVKPIFDMESEGCVVNGKISTSVSKGTRSCDTKLTLVSYSGNDIRNQQTRDKLDDIANEIFGEDEQLAQSSESGFGVIDFWGNRGHGVDWIRDELEILIGKVPVFDPSEYYDWAAVYEHDNGIIRLPDSYVSDEEVLRVIFDGPYSDMTMSQYINYLKNNKGILHRELIEFIERTAEHHQKYLLRQIIIGPTFPRF